MGLIDKTNIKFILASSVLLVTDICSYFFAVVSAYYTRVLIEDALNLIELQFSLGYFLFELWWIFVLLIIFLIMFGVYYNRIPFWLEAKALTKATFLTFILAFAIVSIAKITDNVSRLTLILILFYSTAYIILFRYIVKQATSKFKIFTRNALLIGNTDDIENIAKSFHNEHILGITILGNVSIKSNDKRDSKLKILGNIEDIDEIIKRYNISTVIILQSAIEDNNLSSIVGRIQLRISDIVIIPSTAGIALSNVITVETLMTQLSYLQINNNIRSHYSRFLKRAIDLAVCILFLPLVLIVTLLLFVAIKLDSKGNAFYRHARVGRDGKVIKVIKFRSMYQDADERLKEMIASDDNIRKEWERSFKLKNDPRITKVGNFLRKSSLDELPQIFNVIMGDMSLVGPRPVVAKELEQYYKDFTSYYTMVRPGITGLWQVSGRSDTGYDFRIARDSWYVLNWSVWLDFTILILTPFVVIKRKGAY